ncbi:MAG TPA: HDOD domain-containing protein [Planctomycetaceae bacterium]|nr:HDOD domain-containing protein [Planctomycetaceae bacterium]
MPEAALGEVSARSSMSAICDTTTFDWNELRLALMGQRDSRILPPWVKLPFLPSVLLEFVYTAQSPDSTAEQVGAILEKDAGLTAALLRHVNAASLGFRQPARTAQEAIVRLGLRASTLYLVTTGMSNVLKLMKTRLVNFNEFWCANLERALFARRVADLLGADADLAYTATMLSDCLTPVLVNNATQTYLRFLNLQDVNPTRITEFEDTEFGWNHAEATAYLLDGWNFPPDIVCCVLLHHQGIAPLSDARLRRTAAAAVALAGLLPDPLRQEPGGVRTLRRIEPKWPAFRLQSIVEQVDTEFRSVEAGVRNPMPLVRRVRLAR